MLRSSLVFVLCLTMLCLMCSQRENLNHLAETPPMGWNSWDSFGVDVTEADVKANADYMSLNLRRYGWEYIVVDLAWYIPPELTTWTFKTENPPQRIDEYGRLLPDMEKFPSASEGQGFKPLADYVHDLGLKFGIHIMRGIPRQAVLQNTPILGTDYSAQDIVAPNDTCTWYDGMLGINMEHPGGQAYYNSILQLYADWGVDYIKADDMSHPYHERDIAALHKAIEASGRPIVLSLSPGPAPLDRLEHLRQNANLWRISADFWDDWPFLYRQFELCKLWEGTAVPGHWPDADMLPLGKLRKTGPDDYVAKSMNLSAAELTDEYSRFNDDEKQTLLSLWCIFRSPLMFGGNLPETDGGTYRLITNGEALQVNQHSTNSRQIYRNFPRIVWAADIPNSKDKYIALFNVSDTETVNVSVGWDAIGVSGTCIVRNLWRKQVLGEYRTLFSADLPPHGSGLYRVMVK